MPAINRAACRVHKHVLGKQYLYVFRPEIVLATMVNGNVGNVQTIPTTTLDCTAALRGRTLLVGTAAGGRDKGKIRIRANGDGIGNLYVSEHEINLLNGDHLTVLYDYELWHVDPFITNTGVIYKDCDDVSAPAAIAFPGAIDDIYPPAPVMGPHSIQWLGEQHGFDWSRSWTISPNSGALTFVDAFPLAAAVVHDTPSTGHAIWNVAWPIWVTLELTDDMGGAPDVTAYDAHRLYVTLDPNWTDAEARANGLYVDFRPSVRLGTVDQGGFSMQFTVHVEASEDDFPDGALVIWFFDGGTQGDIGGNWPHRTHIHFIGRITRASTHKEPETGMVTFDAVTVQQEMKSCPTFPNFMEDEAAPTVWTEAHELTVQRAAYLHMRWMSSLLEVADVLFVPTAPTAIGEHEFPESDLYAQLNGLVNRDYLYRIGSDPLCTIYFNKDPQFQTPAVRAGIATIVTVGAEDWQGEIDLPEPILLDTSHVLASGNSYFGGTVSPLFSHAPGPVPLERGKRDRSLSRLICLSQAAPAPQTAINVLSGLALAQANNDFPDIPIKMDGQYYIGHLFPMEFVELDIMGLPLPALTYPGGSVRGTKRNVDLSGEKFIPRRSSLQVVYDKDGAVSQALVDVNVEKVTYGAAGRTLVYPVEPPAPPGPDDGPPDGGWLPPTPPNPSGDPADGNLVYFVSTNGHIYRARNALAAAGAVVYEDLGLVDAGGLQWISLDSWDPKNKAMVCGPNGIWRTDDLNATIPAWTNVLDLSGTLYEPACIKSSICQNELWMCTEKRPAGDVDDNLYVRMTIDQGDNWTQHLISTNCMSTAFPAYIEMSAHDAQVAWLVWHDRVGAPTRPWVTRTGNQWAGWAHTSLVTYTTYWPRSSCHRYFDNPADQEALYGLRLVIRKCTADVGTCTVRNTVSALGINIGCLQVYTWGEAAWNLNNNNDFEISDDGITWAAQSNLPGTTLYIWGWPYDKTRFYGTQNGAVAPLVISVDEGATWEQKTGNWAAVGGNFTISVVVAVFAE